MQREQLNQLSFSYVQSSTFLNRTDFKKQYDNQMRYPYKGRKRRVPLPAMIRAFTLQFLIGIAVADTNDCTGVNRTHAISYIVYP